MNTRHICRFVATLSLFSMSVCAFAAKQGETFSLKREEVIVFGSDAQIWFPERREKWDAKWGILVKPASWKGTMVRIDSDLKPGAIKKKLGPGKYKCEATTFGGDPDPSSTKYCKGLDDLAQNSGRPSIAGNGPRNYSRTELIEWRGKYYNQ